MHWPCKLLLLPLLLLLLLLPLPLPFQVVHGGGAASGCALQLRLAASLAPGPEIGLRAGHTGWVDFRGSRKVMLRLQRRLSLPHA